MADEEQRTPLHWAAGMGHADVAAVLLKEGAKLEAADSKGNTPLMYAGERCSCRDTPWEPLLAACGAAAAVVNRWWEPSRARGVGCARVQTAKMMITAL